MPSKSPTSALIEIRDNIDLALSFVSGLTFDTFSGDKKTVYAVVRCLEIISEASRRLPADLKNRHPNIPWLDVAGAGNIYRHDYENVVESMIWRTLGNSLGALRDAVAAELSGLNEK